MISLDGHLEHITFNNPVTHYTVARMREKSTGRSITLVGTIVNARPGEMVRVTGEWTRHPRYGEQFQIEGIESRLPATVEGIQAYLGSGLIPGIGRKMAARLVRHFGEQTLDVIDNESHRLTEVEGIGQASAARIDTSWRAHHALRHLMTFLQEHGVALTHASTIYGLYGDRAIEVLTDDPFQLAIDMPRHGFVIADTLSRQMGAPPDAPRRIERCLVHLVEQDIADGHLYIPRTMLLARCREVFDIVPEAAGEMLDAIVDDGTLVSEPLGTGDDHAVYHCDLYDVEAGLARRVRAMTAIAADATVLSADQIASLIETRMAINPSAAQMAVLESVFSHRIAVITGGPGTGKTTLIRSITTVLEAMGIKFALAAPTGRASRRLSAVTGHPASTIHRLLGFSPAEGMFDKTPDNPLEVDAVIVDEASMVDTVLMYHLFQAIHLASTVILVGDVHQLPPVGPGNALADMMASGIITTFELTDIFRQALESPIVINAHRVRSGRMPLLEESDPTTPGAEFVFMEREDPREAVDTIIALCTETLPKGPLRLDPVKDVQVLTPMHKADVGTLNLNRVLQRHLNPAVDDDRLKGFPFRVGDKVIHLKNNYQKEVFNGDIGLVQGAHPEDGLLMVDYDDRIVTYSADDMDELALAYAITVHKAQGSEYPVVIIPLMTQHYALLQRNLMYTAMTRARRLAVVVGTRRAVRIALQNDRPRQRRSRLADRLRLP